MIMRLITVFMALFLSCITAVPVMAIPITKDDLNTTAQEFSFIGYSPYPLTTVATDDFTVTGGRLNADGYNFWSQCTVEFSTDVSVLGLNIGNGKTNFLTMAVYDANDILLEQHDFSNLIYPTFLGLDVGSSSISKAIFTATDDLFARSLVYQSESTISPVPEPATMLLFGSGLLGFAGIRRKYKK